jgi:DNA polymerase-3 subunit epsilon
MANRAAIRRPEGTPSVSRVERLVAFDIESTGPDPETDAIVTAFVGLYDVAEDRIVESWDWLLVPRIPISDGAAAVHGITNEFAQEWGTDAALGVFEISQRLDIFQRANVPLVIYNAKFDVTMLDREFRRHYPGGRPFEPTMVLDPFVIDRALNQYRKGKRTLTVVCEHLGIPVETNAHDAGADCLMAARLASYQLRATTLAGMPLERIHAREIEHAASQARGLATYFRKSGKTAEAESVTEHWPLIPYREEQPA